ncbi:hypothetical protein D3C87_1516390 [compost metagenome]
MGPDIAGHDAVSGQDVAQHIQRGARREGPFTTGQAGEDLGLARRQRRQIPALRDRRKREHGVEGGRNGAHHVSDDRMNRTVDVGGDDIDAGQRQPVAHPAFVVEFYGIIADRDHQISLGMGLADQI